MAQYVTKIRTENGDLQIDYNALANLPKTDTTLKIDGAIADAKATGDAISSLATSLNSVIQRSVNDLRDEIANGAW